MRDDGGGEVGAVAGEVVERVVVSVSRGAVGATACGRRRQEAPRRRVRFAAGRLGGVKVWPVADEGDALAPVLAKVGDLGDEVVGLDGLRRYGFDGDLRLGAGEARRPRRCGEGQRAAEQGQAQAGAGLRGEGDPGGGSIGGGMLISGR